MKEYRNELGQYHRVDGPAIEEPDGTKYWYQNGNLHRDNGPACEYASGTKVWCQNGIQHRIDGPAVEYYTGKGSWCLNGCEITDDVETWLKLQGFTVPLDEPAQVLFILRFG